MKRIVAAVAVLVSMQAFAFGQQENVIQLPDREIVKKHTIIDISDVAVEGRTPKPAESFIRVPERPDFTSRMQLRANFDRELQRSTDNL